MSNKITLSDIGNIIDNHFEAERSFVFVCDEITSDFIMNYLEGIYGLEDEDCEYLEATTDEYYVSVSFFKDENPEVFCENARASNGRYKYSEIDDCDYFIMNDTNMCEITADKTLEGEGCTWSWFSIVDEDEDNEYYGEYGEYVCDGDCGCCDCEEPDDSKEEEIRIIGETIQKIFEVYPCPECVSEIVVKLAARFKDIGWTNHQDYIREMNED